METGERGNENEKASFPLSATLVVRKRLMSSGMSTASSEVQS